MTALHFVDVGQGNMTIIELDDGGVLVYDCNITDENGSRVLAYCRSVIGRRSIWFMNSHRDADHMRGLERLDREFTILRVLDSGAPGGTTDSSEYETYMRIARRVGRYEAKICDRWVHGRTSLVVLNSGDNPRAGTDANAGSIVLRVRHTTRYGDLTAMLTGDSDVATWRDWILPLWSPQDLVTDVLLASHHGSDSFVLDDSKGLFWGHLEEMSPGVTVVSVGDNIHGHPERLALASYWLYSRGDDITRTGTRCVRTDHAGTLKVAFEENAYAAYWHLTQPPPPLVSLLLSDYWRPRG